MKSYTCQSCDLRCELRAARPVNFDKWETVCWLVEKGGGEVISTDVSSKKERGT